MNKNCFGKSYHYLLIILIPLFSISAIGQSNYNTTNWRFSNPKQFGFTPLDVDFVDNNIALAVGGDGGIARTTDGGSNWTYGPFTFVNAAGLWQKQSFNDVHFVTPAVAYAVGSLGAMAKSTDGGVTWTLVRTPLFNNARSVNAVWFINENTGYIGGTWNTPDSIPKLYFTNNGGATWDSLNAPLGGKTRVGYINNPNLPPLIWDVTAKVKEIYRIEFTSPATGYITGSGSNEFPRFPSAVAATCLPTGTTTTTGSHNASLVWKFSNGVLTDFSLSKERLGYSGINTNTITCTTTFGNITPMVQQYRAISIINDDQIVLMSFNNNTVIRVYTGVNDNTVNMATGLSERGRYQILNYPFPPTQGPQAGPPIPNPQVLLASNPYHIKKASNGKLYATGNFGRLWTSVNNGSNWVQENCLPQGQNYSAFGTWALDITPNGKFLTLGTNGVVADSTAGSPWRSNYKLPVAGAYGKIDFADCNNGMASGGGSIAVTNDGGKNWFDRSRQDFINLNIQINSHAYVPGNPAKAYFATSVGTIYKSDNINLVPPATPVMDPVFANSSEQMFDIATAGNDSVWACGYSGFSVPAANRSPKVFRSTNGGATWTTYNAFHTGATFQNFRVIEFPSRNTGYVAGTRDTVWKTTDGGVTWSKLPLPTPGITPQITYTDMFALNDNTVFLTGNGFPRKVVFRTTDGGNTWQDITSNIPAIYPVGNMNGVVFHDVNNGYVIGPGGALLITNNGGTSWTLDIAPTSNLFNTLAFSPKIVPAGTPVANRKLFITGFSLPNAAGHIMEYGNPAFVNLSTGETTTSSCDNAAQGTITISATGGIAPYSYSINGGAFQTSNTFSNLTPGAKTITIRDFACGIITKTVTVPVRPAPTVNAGADKTIVEGDDAALSGNSSGSPATIAWTPNSSILSGSNSFAPVVKPATTTAYIMTVTDANGCISTDNAVVTVIPYCIRVMNAFTPNGDGINDVWLVTNGAPCTNNIAVAVYNRYGNVVHKDDSYQNKWDGNYKGKPVADGTYYYTVTFRTITGKLVSLRGDVTVLR
jgi:gliding motility-associated-like protein